MSSTLSVVSISCVPPRSSAVFCLFLLGTCSQLPKDTHPTHVHQASLRPGKMLVLVRGRKTPAPSSHQLLPHQVPGCPQLLFEGSQPWPHISLLLLPWFYECASVQDSLILLPFLDMIQSNRIQALNSSWDFMFKYQSSLVWSMSKTLSRMNYD